jgi:hypothetical protein
MFHTAQSGMEHSDCPSESVWLSYGRAVTIYFIALPGIGWSGMHHIGGRLTPVTSFWPLPRRM